MSLDTIPRVQTGLTMVYAAHILAWFCFLFVVHTTNPPHRHVSALVLVVLVVAAVAAIVAGFVMRKKFFAPSTEAFPRNRDKALSLWRSANVIAFSSALSMSVYAVSLKLAGSSWSVPGILFAMSLVFLVLWRPAN
jgi:hypothetical protein